MTNIIISILLLFTGQADAAQVADRLETHVFEEMADPVHRWRPLVEEHFPTGEIDTAMCIIKYESAGNPRADNPRSTASGLFQVLASLWGPHFGVSVEQLYDAEINTILAREIWDKQGWRAWTTSHLCI